MPASSSVAIVNLALTEMGANTISALADSNVRAETANLFYEQVRDSLLERFSWRFAMERKQYDSDSTGGRELLQDNFDDNSRDTSLWTDNDQAAGSITETGGRLQIVGSGTWSQTSIVSVDVYDLNKSISGDVDVEFKYSATSGEAAVGFSDAAYSNMAQGCIVWFKSDGTISFYINGSETTSSYTFYHTYKYHVQIIYTAPGWEVYITSEGDDDYDDPVNVLDVTTASTGPLYWLFDAKATNTVYFDNVTIASRYEPAFEYGYRYPLPQDCLRVLELNGSTSNYTIEGDSIITNDDTVDLKYIAKKTDTTKYPPVFIECLVSGMKAKMYPKLKGDDVKARDEEIKLEEILIPKACMLDAIESDPAESLKQSQNTPWAREGR